MDERTSHRRTAAAVHLTPRARSRHPINPSPDVVVPFVEELLPAPDPWDAFLRLAGLRHVLFLDSSLPDAVLGRYSFLTADPFDWLCSRGCTPDPFERLAES